ncbi:MAG: histidine kinase [Phycisphaerales bacterium]|nr:histidine kinase [Hyphomonadaceae bacterium]
MHKPDHPAGAAPEEPTQLLETPHLADALESSRFKSFLDHIPFAVVVAELNPSERITYANFEFERLTGKATTAIQGESWDALPHCVSTDENGLLLSQAVVKHDDYIGVFKMDREGAELVDAWSNLIESDDGVPMFRLVALADASARRDSKFDERSEERDFLLRELQHRVKNNLQMITALIRLESRNLTDDVLVDKFDRLAGRVGALALLYSALSAETSDESVDLGVYLSQIASAVMQAHATEGIRLDLKVDAWPVSVNVAMPTGLVVNELLTNSLKHAFIGREGGTITLHSLVDETGCRVVVSDDGVGLPEGATWPQNGKLGMLIVQSLRSNARADIKVESDPESGVCVTIFFAREDAIPAEK